MNFIQKFVILIKNKKSQLAFISFLLTLSSILEVLGIGIIVSFISFLLGTNVITNSKFQDIIFPLIPEWIELEPIFTIGYLFVLIFFLKTVIVIFINYKIEKFSKNVEFNLKETLLKKFILLPDSLYSKQNTSKKIETITRLTQIFQGPCLVSLLKFSSTLIQFLGIFTLLLFTNAIVTLVSTGGLFFIAFTYTKFIKPYSKKYLKEESIASKSLIQSIYEISDGISELKIYDKTNFFLNKFLFYSKKVFHNSLNSSILFFIIKPSLEFLIVLFFVTTALILNSNSVYFADYFDTFSIFVLSLIRILPITTESISSFNRLISSKYAVDTIYDDIYEVYTDDKEQKVIEDNNFNFENITFENVGFNYEPGKTIISNINFVINKNTFVGISGKSGSGKTTIVNLLMGKLIPTVGNININGRIINEVKQNFQKKIAYIQQNPFIFEGTLAENVSLSENCDYDRLIKSLEESELISFFKKNKNKTFGEKGLLLSGGQKQRISIARALYHNRDIIILDEFTNQLDKETEETIMNYIYSLKKFKTIILITHNKGLFKNCDQIVKI